MWKLVSRASTTRHGQGRWMNSSVRPSRLPLAAADSSARTTVVPTATTRRASRQAARVASGTT